MKIRTLGEIRAFEDAVEKCSSIIWLVSPEGNYYNMKSDEEYMSGVECWANDTEKTAEIFTSSYEDEAIMMDFCRRYAA